MWPAAWQWKSSKTAWWCPSFKALWTFGFRKDMGLIHISWVKIGREHHSTTVEVVVIVVLQVDSNRSVKCFSFTSLNQKMGIVDRVNADVELPEILLISILKLNWKIWPAFLKLDRITDCLTYSLEVFMGIFSENLDTCGGDIVRISK